MKIQASSCYLLKTPRQACDNRFRLSHQAWSMHSTDWNKHEWLVLLQEQHILSCVYRRSDYNTHKPPQPTKLKRKSQYEITKRCNFLWCYFFLPFFFSWTQWSWALKDDTIWQPSSYWLIKQKQCSQVQSCIYYSFLQMTEDGKWENKTIWGNFPFWNKGFFSKLNNSRKWIDQPCFISLSQTQWTTNSHDYKAERETVKLCRLSYLWTSASGWIRVLQWTLGMRRMTEHSQQDLARSGHLSQHYRSLSLVNGCCNCWLIVQAEQTLLIDRQTWAGGGRSNHAKEAKI